MLRHCPVQQMEFHQAVRIWGRTIYAISPSVNVQSVPRFLAASRQCRIPNTENKENKNLTKSVDYLGSPCKPVNAGVTVHLVDQGVDTGGVLYQAAIKPEFADCFSTHPTLHLAAGLPLLKRAVQDARAGRLVVRIPGLSSELFYHPTLWQYLRAYVRGVRQLPSSLGEGMKHQAPSVMSRGVSQLPSLTAAALAAEMPHHVRHTVQPLRDHRASDVTIAHHRGVSRCRRVFAMTSFSLNCSQ